MGGIQNWKLLHAEKTGSLMDSQRGSHYQDKEHTWIWRELKVKCWWVFSWIIWKMNKAFQSFYKFYGTNFGQEGSNFSSSWYSFMTVTFTGAQSNEKQLLQPRQICWPKIQRDLIYKIKWCLSSCQQSAETTKSHWCVLLNDG